LIDLATRIPWRSFSPAFLITQSTFYKALSTRKISHLVECWYVIVHFYHLHYRQYLDVNLARIPWIRRSIKGTSSQVQEFWFVYLEDTKSSRTTRFRFSSADLSSRPAEDN
jgi:hypothetical protein